MIEVTANATAADGNPNKMRSVRSERAADSAVNDLDVRLEALAFQLFEDRQILGDKKNCTVGFVNCFLKVPSVYLPCCQGKQGEL